MVEDFDTNFKAVITMPEIKPCPKCGEIPVIVYACGEYFIAPTKKNYNCLCGSFSEMHATTKQEIEAWNRRVEACQ